MPLDAGNPLLLAGRIAMSYKGKKDGEDGDGRSEWDGADGVDDEEEHSEEYEQGYEDGYEEGRQSRSPWFGR